MRGEAFFMFELQFQIVSNNRNIRRLKVGADAFTLRISCRYMGKRGAFYQKRLAILYCILWLVLSSPNLFYKKRQPVKMKLPYSLLFLLLFFPLSSFPQPFKERPRVGVVLSGGGAKGAAHIGVLRAIEEAGVPIDYIAGTSMGAIVGGLYAMGYTVDELDSLVRTADWAYLLSDRPPRRVLSPLQRERRERFVLNIPLSREKRAELNGFVRGRNLGNLLAQLTVGYHDSIQFDSLPIPFACVATNLANGEEVDFRAGVLQTAIRASMAIPGVFTPVEWEGRTLVDGGLVNNFPVDLVRRMGADIVIGATVQRVLADTMEITGMQGVVGQLISISSRRKFEDNIRDCDLHIGVNTQGISTMDFTPAAIDTMVRRGYVAAKSRWADVSSIAVRVRGFSTENKEKYAEDSLRNDTLLSQKGLSENPHPFSIRSKKTAHRLASIYPVREVRFDSITMAEERIIRRACRLKDLSTITQEQIEQAVRILNERFLYLDANYSLVSIGNEYILTFHASRRLASQVGVGGHFDTEELAALLLDADVVFHTHVPSSAELTARLSQQYGVRGSFSVEPKLNHQLAFLYEYRHHDMDVYQRGNRVYNLVFQQHQAGLSFAYRQVRNFDLELGWQLAHYAFDDVLSGVIDYSDGGRLKNDTYFTAFFRLRYNSQDRGFYPSVGSKFFAEYAFTTDNMGRLRKPHAFSSVLATWETVMPLTTRLALQPRIGGRWLIGEDIPHVFTNAVGGFVLGKYVDQQLPFVGISHLETVRNVVITADAKLRYNFWKRQYATLLGALLGEQRNFRMLRHARYVYGLGLCYGYATKFGPIEATISYSSSSRRPSFFMNVGYDF